MKNLVKIHVILPENCRCRFGYDAVERLWGVPLGNDIYRIDNIPACDPDLNYLDEVITENGTVMGILRRGGQRTFDLRFPKLRFFHIARKQAKEQLLASVKAMGTLERFDEGWYGLSVPERFSQDVLALLGVAVQLGVLDDYGSSGVGDRWARHP